MVIFYLDDQFVILSAQLRDDEMDELDELMDQNCYLPVAGGPDNIHGKVNILLQTHLSKGYLKSFSLISDKSYVTEVSTQKLLFGKMFFFFEF
jgi:Sec63 Brl domain